MAVTPSEAYLSELSSTLTALSSAGPEREAAETHLSTTLLKSSPAQLIIALITLSSSTSVTEDQRILALVLFRRLTFQTLDPSDASNPLAKEVWELMDQAERDVVQANLLSSLSAAGSRREKERQVLTDAIAQVARKLNERATPWTQLSQLLPQLFSSDALALRQACWQIYTALPDLLAAEPTEQVIAGLTAGLGDSSPGVRLAALSAAVALISSRSDEVSALDAYAVLATPMLNILPQLAAERTDRLTEALVLFVDLASTPKVPARLFRAHLSDVLNFCLSIITPSPLAGSSDYSAEAHDESARHTALEFLVSLAETAPSLCSSSDFVPRLIPPVLKLMTEREEPDKTWGDVPEGHFKDEDEDEMPTIAESSLDRLSQALGNIVFGPFSESFAAMVAAPQWQAKYAALSALASVAEGCVEPLMEHISDFVNYAITATRDPSAYVRYAAIYALGQLCTDCEGVLQDEFGTQVLQALVEVTSSPQPRLQAYGAAAMVNFFNAADDSPDALASVLPAVFDQLLKLLGDGTITFVKENALEAMTLLAQFMSTSFNPFYPRIFPALLHLLENGGEQEELQTMRAKALDTAASIADAVDSSVFAPDAVKLLSVMQNIQANVDPDDSTMQQYLLRSFAQLAETVGPELFAPYVADVLPRLIEIASREPDLRLTDASEEIGEDDEDDWETAELGDGKKVGLRTTELEEKYEGVNNLVLLVQAVASTLPSTTLIDILQVAKPLLAFYFHVGVREGAAALVNVTVTALAKQSLPEQQRVMIAEAVSESLATHIAADTDAEILGIFLATWATLYTAFPGCLSPAARERVLKAIEAQLTSLTHREQDRAKAAAQGDADADDVIEEMEQAQADEFLFKAINRPIREMLKAEGTSFPLGPLVPFLALVQSTSDGPKHFALKLIADVVENCGPDVAQGMQQYFGAIVEALNHGDPTTRRNSSFLVGMAAQLHPQPYAQLALAAVEPLFGSIKDVSSYDEGGLAARDNAVSALCKIIQAYPDQLDSAALLPRWVATLPVVADGEEMAPTTTLLLELINRAHDSVNPANQPTAVHVTKVLISLVQSELLPAEYKIPVGRALKQYRNALQGDAGVSFPAQVEEFLGAV